MHALLDTLLTDAGATTLLVTHDLEEALKLADRVLLADGRLLEDLRVPLPHPWRRTDVEDLRARLEEQLHGCS
ncbi:ABC transporter-like protein [Deinococcus xianganensis]|uniref:ABC transporter-like protein n=2 Tax=Deinococcus xianganensis TaxID=1507289 RepID=A0A6I4YCW6_9DEIO|nr:ABC transporter-like protein [Deinococcus xianganensis]